MSTNELDLDAIRARADSTHAEVVRQCEGGRWLMSIPARPGYDSDLIISETVRDVEALVAEVRRLRALEASLTEERDTRRETFDTGEPNPLYPGHNRMDTRLRVDRRFVTPWERVE